jgi:hypothetical protein
MGHLQMRSESSSTVTFAGLAGSLGARGRGGAGRAAGLGATALGHGLSHAFRHRFDHLGRGAGDFGRCGLQRARPRGEAEPVRLADHGVARQTLAHGFGDLARRLAVVPQSLQLLDPLTRPAHHPPR